MSDTDSSLYDCRSAEPPANLEKYPPSIAWTDDNYFLKNLFMYNSEYVQQVLGNVHVGMIGDSLMRGMYKDLVCWLQRDEVVSDLDIKTKAEESFMGDRMVDITLLSSDKIFKQAREYQDDYHLVQFFFTTRIFKNDMESMVQQYYQDGYPDVLVLNSCVWDLTKYCRISTSAPYMSSEAQREEEIDYQRKYLERLSMLFRRLRATIPPTTMIIWVVFPHCRPSVDGKGMLGYGFAKDRNHTIRNVMIDGGYKAAQLARQAGFDVLDIGYYFRSHSLAPYQKSDGMHWTSTAVRLQTQLLIMFIAKSWNLPDPCDDLEPNFIRRHDLPQELLEEALALVDHGNTQGDQRRLSQIHHDIAKDVLEKVDPLTRSDIMTAIDGGRFLSALLQNSRRERRLTRRSKMIAEVLAMPEAPPEPVIALNIKREVVEEPEKVPPTPGADPTAESSSKESVLDEQVKLGDFTDEDREVIRRLKQSIIESCNRLVPGRKYAFVPRKRKRDAAVPVDSDEEDDEDKGIEESIPLIYISDEEEEEEERNIDDDVYVYEEHPEPEEEHEDDIVRGIYGDTEEEEDGGDKDGKAMDETRDDSSDGSGSESESDDSSEKSNSSGSNSGGEEEEDSEGGSIHRRRTLSTASSHSLHSPDIPELGEGEKEKDNLSVPYVERDSPPNVEMEEEEEEEEVSMPFNLEKGEVHEEMEEDSPPNVEAVEEEMEEETDPLPPSDGDIEETVTEEDPDTVVDLEEEEDVPRSRGIEVICLSESDEDDCLVVEEPRSQIKDEAAPSASDMDVVKDGE